MSWACVPIAVQIMPVIGNDLRQLYATLNRPPGPIRSLPILVLTVIAEELVWRRELVTWLYKRLPVFGTVAIATLSYAIPIAASKSPLLIAVAICFGVLFTVQRLIFRTWLAPLLAHLVWAILVLVVHPLV
jgi:membrane protease YdiL (CAAX protease family)